MSGPESLVERRVEYDAARDALTSSPPPCCGVVLTGSAGVGKTTLARQVTASLQNVRWIAGTESARAIPLGAFATVVSPSTAKDAVGYLSAARASLLDAGHLLLGVDDAHLLDPLSATLLHQLAIDGDAHIIATIRSGEVIPDAVVSLWKDGYLQRIELDAFTREQSIILMESILGGRVEGLSADLMWEASGGNALFLRHLVDGAREAGSLRHDNGIWQLRGNTSVTTEFAELLENRMAALSEEVTQTLSLLSLCEPISADLLSQVAGEDNVEEAERLELIRITQDGRKLIARFTHPLLGEVVRARIGRLRARRLRGRLVEAMSARGRPPTGTGRIRLAELAVDSDRDVDVRVILDAARSAVGLSDVATGERFARVALARGGGIDAADLLARAVLWQGRPDEVEDVMATISPDDLDEVGRLRWGLTRLASFDFARGDGLRGDEMLAFLREHVTTPSLVLIVDAVEAVRCMHGNDLPCAAEMAMAVLDNDEAIPTAKYWASFAAQRSMALMGRGREVVEVAGRVQISPSMDGLVRYSTAFGELQARLFLGDFAGGRKVAAAYAQFSSPGQYLAWGMNKTLTGMVDLAEGRFDAAAQALGESVAALTSDVMSAWSFPARIGLGIAHAQLGRTAEAKQLAKSARTDVRPHMSVFLPSLRLCEVWVTAAEGLLSQAVSAARETARDAVGCAQYAVAAEALHAAVRLGDPDAATELTEVAEHVDGELVVVYLAHARAVGAKSAAAVEECSTRFERIGALACAADAAAQAAEMYTAAGRSRESSTAATTAHRLAAACGGLVTPALATMGDPLPLTPREREIANLVAAGLTNRAIGERLSLSTRTVEGHIYRACMKLDVADREGLAGRVRGY